MSRRRLAACVTCARCGQVIPICVGVSLAEEFSVPCALCALRGFYNPAAVMAASAIKAARKTAAAPDAVPKAVPVVVPGARRGFGRHRYAS